MSEGGKGDHGKPGRKVWLVLAVVGVVAAVLWADPGKDVPSIDRIFSGAFVAFAVGLVELFVALISLVILGKIDLAKVFQDKGGQLAVDEDKDGEPLFVRAVAGKGAVSLSRLQAFLWTLIIMVIYFHKAVSDGHGDLPTMPSDLLLVMGISGAVYLAGKELATRDAKTAIVHKAGGDAASATPNATETAPRKITASVIPGGPIPASRPSDAGEAGNENHPVDAAGAGQAARLELGGGRA